jgi:hypothetical protein
LRDPSFAEINAMLFAAMMRKTAEERLLMGFGMMATARELVWRRLESQLEGLSQDEGQRLFYERFHGTPCPW